MPTSPMPELAPHEASTPPPQTSRWPGVLLICGIVLLLPFALRERGPVREAAPRSVAASNLRQIGQANLIYASDHLDQLPRADNIWNYAAELARDGGLNDASTWVAAKDPANTSRANRLSTVLTADRKDLEPSFRELVPSWAVALGELDANMPATMPLAWTRGLRPDGTWSPHSPYGIEGGYIVFLGGNVTFFRNVKGALVRFDDGWLTSNILEALPPGTRIGEYVPNPAEQADWERTRRLQKTKAAAIQSAPPMLWFSCFLLLLVQALRKKWRALWLWWFLFLSLLAACRA